MSTLPQMTVDDRLAYIQKKQLCSNCFASSHQFRDCTSAHDCLTCQDRTLLHRNSGPTTPPTPSDPPRPVSASVPHIISSYSAQVSVQKVPPKNTPSEYWDQYPALDGRRTRGIKSYQCRVCQNPSSVVYVKRAFNFRRQCRTAVLSRCLHLALSHCRPLSLSISPLSLRSALERLS